MSKKIGILTLHYGLNYGGVLQTYATMQTLRSLGYEPVLIDRLPDSFRHSYPLNRRIVHPLTQHAFYQFRKNELQPISRPIRTSPELTKLLSNGGFHGILIGSDQVWRKEVFSVDGDYFLIHQKHLALKKVAYSASTGVGFWQYDESETRQITEALRCFNGLSCREAESVDLFRNNCGLEIQNILDPTLIASPTIYDSLKGKARINGFGKLVTYMLDWDDNKNNVVADICKMKKLQPQHILQKENKRKGFFKRIIYQDPSVYDWVNQIATADFVVTDSFHGMAFSIIFNKQFVVIGNPKRGMARFSSLLKHLNLQHRLTDGSTPDITADINYTNINICLTNFRKQGINFLKTSL